MAQRKDGASRGQRDFMRPRRQIGKIGEGVEKLDAPEWAVERSVQGAAMFIGRSFLVVGSFPSRAEPGSGSLRFCSANLAARYETRTSEGNDDFSFKKVV